MFDLSTRIIVLLIRTRLIINMVGLYREDGIILLMK